MPDPIDDPITYEMALDEVFDEQNREQKQV